MSNVILVMTHLPDQESARRLAHALIENRAAACVNILAECSSLYRWQEEMESAREIPLMIKTTQDAYSRVEALIRKLHPYELPEVIAVPVTGGLPGYLQWVREATSAPVTEK